MVKSYLKPFTRLELPAFLMLCIWTYAAIWHFRNAQLDDAFITYRFARNIASGLGFTYNPPQQVLGTTTPLYTFLLATAGVLTLDIPSVSLFINAASILALATMVYMLSEPDRNRWSALLPALLVAFLPGTYTVLGMETLLYTALLYSGFYAASRAKFTAATIIAALATLTRYDGVLFAGVLFLQEWRYQKKLPWWNILLFGVMLLPWVFSVVLAFGSPLPVTFYAKTGGHGSVYLKGMGDNLSSLIFFAHLPNVIYLILYFFLGIMIVNVFLLMNSHFLRWLFLWVVLYIASYNFLALRYTQHWYYYPILPALLLFISYGFKHLINVMGDRLMRFSWLAKRFLFVVGLLPILCMVFLGMINLWNNVGQVAELGGRYQIYREAALWVCMNTKSDHGIAVPEIGIVGWFCNQKIIDPYGLVTLEMLPYIEEDNRLAGLASLEPDVIIIQNYPKDSQVIFPSADSFKASYTPVKVFTKPHFPYAVVIFSRNP